jgi:DNA-directed RNA polymerase subunit L
MGNVCASSRNSECLHSAKNPHEVTNAFKNCVYYTKVPDPKKTLKKRKRKLLQKVASIQSQLSECR